MRKIYFILSFMVAGHSMQAQAGFTKVVDATNPVTLFVSAGFYKGASWIDYDNDNDPDLFAAPNFLFRNDGGGVFVQLPNPFAFTPLQNPGGASWADLNNDGFIDCIIAQNPSNVYTNNGNGTFTNVSGQIPNLSSYPAWGCAIGDWNKDAFPDFIFAHAANFHNPGPFPSKLYLNTNPSVMPQNVTGYLCTDSVKPYTVPYWSDYDLDGDMDLFIATGPGGSAGPDYCYKNMKMETGLDTLHLMTSELFTQQLQDGQCYNFIDYDNDGDFDLCLTNYAGAQTRFYLNNNGSYVTQSMPFTVQTSNLTNDWGDFDNDGDLDVIITNDQQVSKYYKNNGNGTFASAINIGLAGGCGVTNGDYDNDGDLDFFIHGNGNSRALFRNDTTAAGKHWVNIRCIGTNSNRSAIGTIVKLKATIYGSTYWQIREINAQNSFQSQNDLRVHFGLGDAPFIDSVIVIWPSGLQQAFSSIGRDTFYTLIEGSGLTSIENQEQLLEDEFKILPNPASSEMKIMALSGNEKYTLELSDAEGKIRMSKSFAGNDTIDVSGFANGSYLLRISKGSKSVTKKIVVAK